MAIRVFLLHVLRLVLSIISSLLLPRKLFPRAIAAILPCETQGRYDKMKTRMMMLQRQLVRNKKQIEMRKTPFRYPTPAGFRKCE